MVAINTDEFQKLWNHLAEKPKLNMHTRKTRQLQGERILSYLNIMTITTDSIVGHVAGEGVDFEYEVRSEAKGGVIRIIRYTGSLTRVLDILAKEKNLMLARVATDRGESHPVKYKADEFYVKRASIGRNTPALEEALRRGVVPASFAKNLVSWNFILIKGRQKESLF